MSIVLVSIKPVFTNKILSKEKQYEYRRVFNIDVDRIYIYSTSPIQRIVGEAKVKVLKLPLKELWCLTAREGGITKDEFYQYFNGLEEGYALKILNLIEYQKPINPKELIQNFRAPQSYMFVEDLNLI